MPQGRDHIYFLMNEANSSYYVSNGMVLTTTNPKPLQYTPDGWRNIQLSNIRNTKYFALDRSFSVPLDFVKDGAQILKYLYYNRGIEEKVFMCIAKQVLFCDATTYGYYYTLLYKGEIDLANFKHDGPKVTVNIMEGGPVKYIKANENTTYELDMDVPEAINIKMDGVRLKQSASFLMLDGALDNAERMQPNIPELVLLGSEQITTIGAKSTSHTVALNSATGGDVFTSKQNFLSPSNTTEITITYDFGVALQLIGVGSIPNTHYLFQIHGYDKDGNRIVNQNIVDHTADPLLLYQHHRFSGAATYVIPDNVTELYLRSTTTLNGNNTMFTYDNDGSIKVDYNYVHRTTYIKALRPLYVLQQLINRIIPGGYTVSSTALTDFQDIVITCGDAIRGISASKLKTTLSAFFQSFNSVLGIGIGQVRNVLRCEQKAYWVDYSDPIDLGEVKNLKISPATDQLINNLKIGYPEKSYEDVNGRQEFNNTQEYSTAVTRITKSLDMVSSYRADCYGIEFTRINLDGKTTTDSTGDNDVFLIHIKDNPITEAGLSVYELDRVLNATASGLLETATVFNLFLTPKHNMYRNGNYFHSLFYKMDNSFFTFRTTEKNSSVVTDVMENADVEIGILDPQLFTPNTLDFESRVPVNQVTLLEQNPLRAFKGTFVGVPFVGIPIKVSARPADKASQEYTLLSSPSNDLTLFEKING